MINFDRVNQKEKYDWLARAKRVAQQIGREPDRELIRYALHGLLHIAGYDHKKSSMKQFMQKKEEDYLKIWESL